MSPATRRSLVFPQIQATACNGKQQKRVCVCVCVHRNHMSAVRYTAWREHDYSSPRRPAQLSAMRQPLASPTHPCNA